MGEIKKYAILLRPDVSDVRALEGSFSERGFELICLHPDRWTVLAELPRPPAALIIEPDFDSDWPENVIERIKNLFAETHIPVLGLLSSVLPFDDYACDSVLLAPLHPKQIVLRTVGLARLAGMQQEILHRLQTLEQDFSLSCELPDPGPESPFRILFVGKASPEFMVVINALQKRNVIVVAAFTSFTAFDYLYEQSFDAVVINGLGTMEPALSVTQAMRKNARLFNVPVMLLVDSEHFKDQDAVFKVGMDDILDAKSGENELSNRVIEHANFHRLQNNLKSQMGNLGGDLVTDRQTGLYNEAFFNAHLSRVYRWYSERALPVSLCLIKVTANEKTPSKSSIVATYQQIGALLKNMVRLQDITARIAPNVFVIAFPGQTPGQIKPVEDRITSILKCAVLSDPETGDPLHIKLDVHLSLLEHDESSENVA